MHSSLDNSQARPPLKVWWIILAVTLLGLLVMELVFGRGSVSTPPPGQHPLFGVIGMVPLFISIVIRWLVLPRVNSYQTGFVFFVAGIALAEAGGVLGIFLGGVYRDTLVILAVLSVVQFMPFYAKGLRQPRPTQFIPNN